MAHLDPRLVLHGSIVLLVGLIGGFAMRSAIKNGRNEVPWRVVHSGGSAAGALLLALAGIVRALDLPGWGLNLLVWLMIGGVQVLVGGMVLAALSGQRGIIRAGNMGNRLVYGLYVVGSTASLVGGILLVVACFFYL